MSEARRVVVTGAGTVNALSSGGADAVAAALAAPAGIGPVRAFSTDGIPSHLAAEVPDDALGRLLERDAARRLSRICRLAVAACQLAVRDAGVAGGPDLAIVVGSEHGDFRSSAEFADGFLVRGPAGLSPLVFPNTVMNTMASAAAIAVRAQGASITLNQPTVVGDLAVARATALVRSGRAVRAIAGGVDELWGPVYRELTGMRALSPMRDGTPEGCRPYARDHSGPVLGEGATFVVLESLDAVRERGGRILAEVEAAAWGNVPVAPHGARSSRVDGASPVSELLRARVAARGAFDRCYGAANGDPALDDWEQALLARDLGDDAGARPPVALAAHFGQHGGVGVLRVAAAALDVAAGCSSVLVHGIARGGCRTALVLTAP